jgi:spermidine synthase
VDTPIARGQAGGRLVYASSAVWGFSLAALTAAWNRILPPVFGYSALAGLWVQCAILIGVGSGCAYIAARMGRAGRPSRILALFDMGAAAAAIAAYLLLAGIEPAYVALSGGFRGAAASSLLGMLLVGAIVFVPAFLAGCAAALVLRSAIRSAKPGGSIGAALAILILGLAGGTLVSGFLLLPGLGTVGTLLFGACPLAAIGALLLVLQRRPAPAGDGAALEIGNDETVESEPGTAGPYLSRARIALLLLAIFVFSVAASAIFWTDMLGQFMGRTAYARAATAGVFLAAIGLGGLLAAPLRSRWRAGRAAGLFMGAAGLAWLALLFLEEHLAASFIGMFAAGPAAWGTVARSYFGLALLTAFVPGGLSGLAWTLAVGWASRSDGGAVHADGLAAPPSGGRFPSRYFILVMAAGWLAACLVSLFLPGGALGLKGVATAAPIFAVASAVVLLALHERGRVPRLALPIALAGAALVITLVSTAWNAGVLSSGVFMHPERLTHVRDLTPALRSADVPFIEARDGNVVSVSRSADGLFLKINGVPSGASLDGFPSQVLTGQLPLLIAGSPENVLVLGLGTGITAGSAETHGISRIDCVEQHKSVAEASRYFSPYNLGALLDRRLRLIYCDPTNYVLLSRERYDAVISTQPVPGEDFVRLARARLSPRGVLCQAVDLDLVGEDGLKSMAREFAYFFPNVALWWTGSGHVLIAASLTPFRVDNSTLRARLGSPGVKGDLARLGGLDNVGILSLYLLGREALLDWAGDVPVDTRTRSFLLYQAPRRLAMSDNAQILIELGLHEQSPADMIGGLEQGGAGEIILRETLRRCMDARDSAFRSLAVARDGRLREAVGYLEDAAGGCPENGLLRWELSDFCIAYSRALIGDDRFAEAVSAARRAVEANPDNYRAYYNLATLETKRDLTTARDLLRRAIQINPAYFPAELMQAEVEISAGMINEASETLDRGCEI